MKEQKQPQKSNTAAYVGILVFMVIFGVGAAFIIPIMAKNGVKEKVKAEWEAQQEVFDYSSIAINSSESDRANELSRCEKYNEGENSFGKHASYKCPHGEKFVHLNFVDGELVSKNILNY